ncbi:MAG TPA: O-antigen ligase family protein [Streptosporangiaceae bacterium]
MTYAGDDDATIVFPAVTINISQVDTVRMLTAYAVLLFLIPATLIFAPLGGEGTPAMVFSLCIFLWYLASWISGRIEPTGGGRTVRITMLIFAIAVLASFVAAMTRDITQTEVLAADSALVWLVSGAGLVIVITETMREFDRLEVLLRRLVVLGSVIAAIGILQFRGIDLTTVLHIPGLTVNSQDVIALMDRGGFIRPQSTASQPIEFSVVMALLLPLAIEQAFRHEYGGWLRRWVPVGLIGFAGPLTVSRSGIIGIGAGLLVLLPTWKLRRILGALGVLAVGVGLMRFLAHGLVTTFLNLFQGIFNGQDSSVNARVADYSGVSQYIVERPLFGRGFGTFLPQLYRYTDNMYLLAVVEIGVVGVIAIVILFCSGIQSAVLGRRRTRLPQQRATGQALAASMVVALVTSATFDSFTFPMFSGLFFVLMGCCGAYCTIMTRNSGSPFLTAVPAPIPGGQVVRVNVGAR